MSGHHIQAGWRGLTGRRNLLVAGASVAAIAALVPVYRLQSLSWAEAAAASTVFVLPCAVLCVVVWRVLGRGTDASIGRKAARHVSLAVAFSVVWTTVFASLVYLLRPQALSGFLRDGAVWQFVWGLVIYGGLALAARLQSRLQQRELAIARAELLALRAQLNPHFLFNTLHSLGQLAREDPLATQQAIERFGDLMRYVLDAGRPGSGEVSLEEELRFVRSYLAVEALRLGDRLRVVEDIEPDALELAVPPLLLQPLVENAVRHGLAPRRLGGTIRLSAHLTSSTLAVEIADDGDGADPDAWRSANGLGLKAVCRQLNAAFPGAARIRITTRPQAGFAAHLEMPQRVAARALP